MAIVETTGGRIRGGDHGGALRFTGIPYAAPPVGPLRFRPPAPPEPWSGIRDATEFGPVAPQAAGGVESLLGGAAEAPPQSEDCLSLNVYTPAADDGRRPVMFWIHGGGYTGGSGRSPMYDGAPLARRGDVVVVTINYRLGFLGFGDVSGLDPDYASATNAGILDQVASLGWVRDNIEAFGGDPANVTIFGESAGGGSVASLLATPAANGLYHRAIIESGVNLTYTPTPDMDLQRAKQLFEQLGVSTIDDLLAVDAERFHEAAAGAGPPAGGLAAGLSPTQGFAGMIGPSVEPTTMPATPRDSVRDGSAPDVPILIGTTRDEWNLFGMMARGRDLPEDALAERLAAWSLDPEVARAAYGQDRPGADTQEVFSAAATDLVFRIQAIRVAEAAIARGGSPVYLYRFDWPTPIAGLGACHAIEIPFVFGVATDTPGFVGPQPPPSLVDAMGDMWVSFARSGDPNTARPGDAGGAPEWPPYELETRPTMLFDETCTVASDPDAASRAVWDRAIR